MLKEVRSWANSVLPPSKKKLSEGLKSGKLNGRTISQWIENGGSLTKLTAVAEELLVSANQKECMAIRKHLREAMVAKKILKGGVSSASVKRAKGVLLLLKFDPAVKDDGGERPKWRGKKVESIYELAKMPIDEELGQSEFTDAFEAEFLKRWPTVSEANLDHVVFRFHTLLGRIAHTNIPVNEIKGKFLRMIHHDTQQIDRALFGEIMEQERQKDDLRKAMTYEAFDSLFKSNWREVFKSRECKGHLQDYLSGNWKEGEERSFTLKTKVPPESKQVVREIFHSATFRTLLRQWCAQA